MTLDELGDATQQAWSSAGPYLRRFYSSTPKQKSKLLNNAPLADLQTVALNHPDPFVRRDCLFFLDHHANEESASVFTGALQDPVDFVRNAALHSIACESCRTTDLCVADVVPQVIGVLENDPRPDLRAKAIPTLLRLGLRDARAWEAISAAAELDPDRLVRQAATDALRGHFVAPRKRYERRERRHAKLTTRAQP